jgi:DNA invertase Pin-like site-specific DNA recombinase
MGKRVKVGNPKIAVAYIRASKDEQKLTLGAQRASIASWAAQHGVSVASWHEDAGVCSVTPLDNRTALPGAFAALRSHGAGVLVVACRDRLARDPMLTGMAEHEAARAGAVIVSAAGEGNGTTPADEMMRGIVDVFARHERRRIQERTRTCLRHAREQGQFTGGTATPYGFRLASDGQHVTRCKGLGCSGCRTLEPVPSEQSIIETARTLRATGKSLAAVAAQLTAEGFLSRTGRPFAASQVQRMLQGVQRAA